MFSEIRIYYEGDVRLKEGFRAFFGEIEERAKAKGLPFRLIDTNGDPDGDFGIAIRSNPNAWNILLKDSEHPHSQKQSRALCTKNHWSASHANSIFWMVEMMESWFHADKDTLGKFYGNGFKRSALKTNPRVEQISKKDLESGLRAATKATPKGNYFDHKAEHGGRLLSLIDPKLVRQAAPNCEKLFAAVLARFS